jgi:hypothetical protein
MDELKFMLDVFEQRKRFLLRQQGTWSEKINIHIDGLIEENKNTIHLIKLRIKTLGGITE